MAGYSPPHRQAIFLAGNVDDIDMWRVIGVIERMGSTLGQASVMLNAVLSTMDSEMERLHTQLESDAARLRTTVADLEIPDVERQLLMDVVERIENTAARVASFAHRPADAEAQIDALLDPSTMQATLENQTKGLPAAGGSHP